MNRQSGAETPSVTSLLEDVLAECLDRFAGDMAQRNLNLIDRTRYYGHAWYRAERCGMQRLLGGILSNAIKYSRPGGTVLLSCYAVADDRLRLCVTDNGPGIPAKQLVILNRASPVLHSGSVIPALVEFPVIAGQLGIRVGAAVTPGEGSTVWLELPGYIESWRPEPMRYAG